MSALGILILALEFSAERSVEVAAGGRVETQVGVVPVSDQADAQPSVAVSVIPVLGLQHKSERLELTGLYRPRIYWRFPNRIGLMRPLILHQLRLVHSWRFSPRTEWDNSFFGSIGEVDYTLASNVFPESQPTVPTEDVIDLVRLNAQTGVQHAFSRRANGALSLRGTYNTPLGDVSELTYQESITADLVPSVGFAATRRDAIDFSVGMGFAWSEDESTYIAATPQADYTRQFGRQSFGRIGAGIAYVELLHASNFPGASPAGTTEVTPIGDAEFQTMVWSERGQRLDLGAFGSFLWFYDPVLARPVRRLGFGVNALFDAPPDWTAAATVSFFTTIGEGAFSEGVDGELVRQDETALRVDVPVTYAIDDRLGLEFGVRSALRGPPLSDGLALDQVEAWFYGALRIVFDPDDRAASWNR